LLLFAYGCAFHQHIWRYKRIVPSVYVVALQWTVSTEACWGKYGRKVELKSLPSHPHVVRELRQAKLK
jgi:hypothetical protein